MLQTQLKWTRTDEKLPPRGRRVIGYFEGGEVVMCRYHGAREFGSWPHKNLWTRAGGYNITQPDMWSYFKEPVPESVKNDN